MGREEQIIGERIRKLNEIREQGINPYPNKFERTHTCDELQSEYAQLENEARAEGLVKVAGRLMGKRDMGKISFSKLKDGSGTIQIILQEGETDDEKKRFFKKYVDSGDFIGIAGIIMRSKRGELSILVKDLTMLSKSTLPLPEKWHGITNEEERYRKRYLDILMNDDVKDMFIKKNIYVQTIRNFLIEKGFIEVQTPLLETSAGGAAATPFATHHNALDLDVYLRISVGELWQKKLMIAGYDKTFEMGRIFRNEGMDMDHLQDYLSMEFYWAYANYEDGMKLVEEMYKKVAKEVLGTYEFETHGHKINLDKKWEIYDYEKTIKKYTDIDIYEVNATDIKNKLDELKIEYDKSVDKWRLVDILWKVARKKLSGPGFLTGQPVEVSPLAKRNPKDPRKVEQFQVIIAGSELGNGYSELNDAQDQEERFKKQAEQKEAGDDESMDHDKSFVEALKHGMPPTCGFGVSERFFGYLMDKSLRECTLFPLMRPEEKEDEKSKKKTKKIKGKTINTKLPISRDEAIELLKEHNKNESDFNHYLESEVVMKFVARKIGKDEEYYGMLGLLHDVDWGNTKAKFGKHLTEAPKILSDAGFDDDFVKIIVSHGYGFVGLPELADKKRSTTEEHALAASETLTGLIHAYARMKGKKISEMELKGLMKKFKDKKFAAAINRDIVEECENIEIPIDEFLELSIEAITSIKSEVGLI